MTIRAGQQFGIAIQQTRQEEVMTIQRDHRYLAGLVAAAVLLSDAPMAIAQPSGTVLRHTMTGLSAASPVMEINIPTMLPAHTGTELLLEFGPDGNGGTNPLIVPNPSLPASVNFKITTTINTAVVNFSPSGGVDASSFPNKMLTLSLGDPDPTKAPGFYILKIDHSVGTTTPETWKLEITGLPTSLRVMGSVHPSGGEFKSLTPVGVCQGGQCPRVCPVGESCQRTILIAPFPWQKYVEQVIDLHWPIPPNPCLSCPAPWDTAVRDGFERVMVSVTPYVRPGEPLGPGKVSEINLNIRGGEPVGGLADAGRGQYLQLIEYRKGEQPRVSAAAAGVTTAETLVGPAPSAAERTYRILTYVLGALLLIALVVIGWLTQRGGRAASQSRG